MTDTPKLVYLVILQDRHTDDTITVHLTRAGADETITRIVAGYGDRNEWHEKKVRGEVRSLSTGEGGPKIRIELAKVLP